LTFLRSEEVVETRATNLAKLVIESFRFEKKTKNHQYARYTLNSSHGVGWWHNGYVGGVFVSPPDSLRVPVAKWVHVFSCGTYVCSLIVGVCLYVGVYLSDLLEEPNKRNII